MIFPETHSNRHVAGRYLNKIDPEKNESVRTKGIVHDSLCAGYYIHGFPIHVKLQYVT